MRLSEESRPLWWLSLAAVWVTVALLVAVHAVAVRDYLSMSGGLGLRGASAPSTPLRLTIPFFAADAQTWIRHAISLSEGNGPRLRFTTIDNAPAGREVHWSSAWAWTIVGAGRLDQRLTGESFPRATEHAARWLNAVVLMALVIGFSFWTARRAGAAAGVVVALGMVGVDQFYEGFYPTYVDHHGLLTAAVFGLMLGGMFMGAGWWVTPERGAGSLLPTSQRDVRRSAMFSAICGAVGMWISAASLVPPVAIIGVSGLAAALIQARALQGRKISFDGGAWRLWGRVGAGLSLVFYLVEYVPSHVGLRLDVNHPFYALAWLGGGELIAQVVERWLAAPALRWANPLGVVWPLLAVAVAPITMLLGGPAAFAMRDPFLFDVHRNIYEFLYMWDRVKLGGWGEFFRLADVNSLVLIVALVLLCVRSPSDKVVLWFSTLATLAFLAMAYWQVRWLLNASGPEICLTLVVLAAVLRDQKALTRWVAVLAVVGLLYVPSTIGRIREALGQTAHASIDPRDALQPLYRDVAGALRASAPTADVTVLSSPNSSVSIGYYGLFKTIGTLYWENNEGLKIAARIFSAHEDKDAAALIRARRITHIAMISEQNFIGPYYALLHPGAAPDDVKKSFGYRLLASRQFPEWLRPIPYQVPDDLRALNVTVLLFKVTE